MSLPAGTPTKVSLSPDARHVAIDLPVPGTPAERDIVLLDLESGRVSPIPHPATDAYPVWTPDGRLLFASDRAGSFGLWLQHVSARGPVGEPNLVQRDIGSLLPPAGVSPSGTLYYRMTEGLVDVEMATLGPATGPRSVSGQRAARRVQGVNLFPDWSADGRRLVFTSRLGTLAFDPGAHVLVLADLDSGRERTLQVSLGNMALPRWSPDMRTIAVQGVRNGLPGTYLVASDTGHVMSGPIASQAGAEWAQDGRALYLIKGRDLVRHDIASGLESVIYQAPDGSHLGYQVLSRAGDELAVAEYRRAGGIRVLVLPATGGEAREIHAAAEGQTLSLAGWGSDRDAVYMVAFTPGSPNAPRKVWRLSTTGAAPVDTGLAHASMRDVRISPDASRVAYTAGWPTRASWVLENFLPPARRPTGK